MEEIFIFANKLTQSAGLPGTWGPVVRLEKIIINFFFNIIARATMCVYSPQISRFSHLRSQKLRDMHLHEQTRDEPSPLQGAFYGQMLAMGATTLPLGRLFTWTPWYRARLSKSSRVIQRTSEPQIRRELNFDEDRMSSGNFYFSILQGPGQNYGRM